MKSGPADLNIAISGNAGQNVGPKMVWREGVFHGQEISTPNPAHPYNGVQSPSGTGSIARRQNDVSAARADITDYFTWYNTERAHSSLDRMTPKQSYLDLLPKLQEAA